MFVPVVDKDNKPLMPTKPSRARRWIKSGKATPFWKKGIFCVRLNVEPSARNIQPIAVGIDPGSKKEAFTVKSEIHTYFNLQADAVTWVKDAVKTRREMRRGRRFRKTPCRQPKFNRKRGGISPSIKARWQWKLRMCWWLRKIVPLTDFSVEDIAAMTKQRKRRWNVSFSPLEVGKKWFYGELEKIGNVHTLKGYETKELRDRDSLQKSSNKLKNNFSAHCVDSWVLANWFVGGHISPDNKEILFVTPLRFHRRQLHALQPAKGGIRRPYGGTRSLGFKRGSYVKHPKYGVCLVGGASKGRLSLHSLIDGKRLTQTAKPSLCKHLTYASFRTWR
ncbi:RRXRR domain-containing protein [Candidatus Poribacteria bacterium]|nr:RRXRR domain-containing protein [Candidatus Poribacteria bacterium]